MNITVIILSLLLIGALALIIMMYLGKIQDKDKDMIPDALEDIGSDIKGRAKRVGEELKDVVGAVKEVGNQIGDLPSAVAGKDRSGRKSNK